RQGEHKQDQIGQQTHQHEVGSLFGMKLTITRRIELAAVTSQPVCQKPVAEIPMHCLPKTGRMADFSPAALFAFRIGGCR
ncbi:hypothetical protein, partial [Chitinimonas sp.]|uniref:hypothetical protein n=1 Tax=Chitinimonas sp. TaxID=1934313 RepID=UPI0035B3E3C9